MALKQYNSYYLSIFTYKYYIIIKTSKYHLSSLHFVLLFQMYNYPNKFRLFQSSEYPYVSSYDITYCYNVKYVNLAYRVENITVRIFSIQTIATSMLVQFSYLQWMWKNNLMGLKMLLGRISRIFWLVISYAKVIIIISFPSRHIIVGGFS